MSQPPTDDASRATTTEERRRAGRMVGAVYGPGPRRTPHCWGRPARVKVRGQPLRRRAPTSLAAMRFNMEVRAIAIPKPSLRSMTALEPLSVPVFRLLWSTWLTANLCMWMTDVASAWTMTTLTRTPIWVALVQSASTLPVFLLGLPSGALADILDRRRWLTATQFWLAATATALCAVTALGWMTTPLLLVLVFLNGIGLALRWPVFSAIVPELVPKTQLATALAL